MDVVLTVARQVVVDDQAHLLHVDTAGPHIGGDEHAAVTAAEVVHDAVALLLRHLAVHAADGEVGLAHLLGQPVDLAAGVAEDDGLGDGEGVVEVAQGVELPVLLLDGDKVLLEALEGQLVALDEDAHGVGHELGGHVEHVVGQGGADDDDLGGGRQVAVHVVDLLAEALVQQLVGLVQHQHLDVARAQVAAADHVGDAARRAGHDVLAVVELADVLADVGAADAGVALHVHVVAEGHDDGLDLGGELARGGEDEGLGLAHGGVDDLEHADREGGRLTRAGLGLGDGVAALADLHDGARLHGRGGFVAVGVDAAEEVLCGGRRAEVSRHCCWWDFDGLHVAGDLPFRDMASKVGWTVTSLLVVNSMRSSALRSMPAPSAMVPV